MILEDDEYFYQIFNASGKKLRLVIQTELVPSENQIGLFKITSIRNMGTEISHLEFNGENWEILSELMLPKKLNYP